MEMMCAGLNNHSHADIQHVGAGIEGHRPVLLGIATLVLMVAASVLVFVYRDEIARFASLGYVATAVACFVLNCGVFGLSPSGAVAVQMSLVLDPVFVSLAAGLGAGLGEVTSYWAGKATRIVRPDMRWLARLEGCGGLGVFACAFAGSFISGNASDAIGLVCGRLGKAPLAFMTGAVLAKIAKMLLLVFLANGAFDVLGLEL